MLQAILWAITCFLVSLIMAVLAGKDDNSFLHNIASFFATVFSLAFWGCILWFVVMLVKWAVPIMGGR